MDVRGKTIVVNGGTGVAGEAVTEALLRNGASVAVTSRSPDKLAKLASTLDTTMLHTFDIDGETVADWLRVRDKIIQRVGSVDGVVASLGGWWEGPDLTEIDRDVWDRIIDSNLTSHFLSARAWVPYLRDRSGSVYVTLGGIAATIPTPYSAPVSVTGAAQTRLIENIQPVATSVRFHEVQVLTPIVTRHWDRDDREPEWLTGAQVGEYVVSVIAGELPGYDPERLILPIP